MASYNRVVKYLIKKYNRIDSLDYRQSNIDYASSSTKTKPFEIEQIQAFTSTKKVWIETYGCSANTSDSEMIAGLLKSSGYELAADEEESGLNIIVTCSVKDVTQHRMLYRINKLSKTKKPLVIAGCLPKTERQRIESVSPSASLIGPHSINSTIDVVHSAFGGKKLVYLNDSLSSKLDLPKIRVNPVIGIIEIASGCISECSFCQTKLAKGKLRSYRIGEITRQMRRDIADGCKEIWLSSTDNGCYGKDIGCDLVELLTSCCEVEGDYKIRIGMMNPMYLPCMIEDIIKVFSDNDKIFRFLHIPVQAGSDRILRKMKRGHSVETYRNIVKSLRNAFPEITIATDVIVGFPSETSEDFLKTIALIKETEPDVVNSSKYSARSGTEASKLERVDSITVKRRSEYMHEVIKETSLKRNAIWNGWRGDIIIDEIRDNIIQGRNFAYKPILLSPEFLDSSKASRFKINLGDKIPVEVCSFSTHSLISRVLN